MSESAKMEDLTNAELSEFIGSGIDLINAKGPFADQLKHRILKSSVVKIVSTTPVIEGHLNIQSTDSLKEIYSKWNINAGVEAKTPFFSGDFQMEYSNESRNLNCNKFFKGVIHIKGYSHMLNPTGISDENRLAIVDYLIENGFVQETALKDINNNSLSPQQLFNMYGTHVVIGGLTGGSIQLTAKYSSDTSISNESFSATLKFACGYITGNSSGGFKEEQKAVLENTDLKATSRAGDPRIIGKLNTYEAIPEVFKEWAESVTESTYVLSDITSAIPIWEFCEKEDHKSALQSAYTGTTNERFMSIESYFPSPKEMELVTIYSAYKWYDKDWGMSKNTDGFAQLGWSTPTLTLKKEMVSSGIFRFSLANATYDNCYLRVAEKGPYGVYTDLSFTGSKDNEYTQFYLKRNPEGGPNCYNIYSPKVGLYMLNRNMVGNTVVVLGCTKYDEIHSYMIYPSGNSPATWGSEYPKNIAKSLPTTHTAAQFRYTPDFEGAIPQHPANILMKNVDIEMTGSRSRDFAAANAEAGYLFGTPKGYTWHHLYGMKINPYGRPTCRMQLIDRNIHRPTCAHIGSVYEWCQKYKQPYRWIHKDDVEFYANTENNEPINIDGVITMPPPDEVVKYCRAGKLGGNATFVMSFAFSIWVNLTYGILSDEVMKIFKAAPVFNELVNLGNYPIGEDEAGNIVLFNAVTKCLYLYDHEMSINGKDVLIDTQLTLEKVFGRI